MEVTLFRMDEQTDRTDVRKPIFAFRNRFVTATKNEIGSQVYSLAEAD
jgi:hypothetical protein